MPEFKDLPDDFCCPHRNSCPSLEGLSTSWVFHRYQEVAGTECEYEYQLEELNRQLQEERRQRQQVELENQQLKAQLHALHRRQQGCGESRRTAALRAAADTKTTGRRSVRNAHFSSEALRLGEPRSATPSLSIAVGGPMAGFWQDFRLDHAWLGRIMAQTTRK